MSLKGGISANIALFPMFFFVFFSSILNDRLQNWARETNINSDAQFGFKEKHSTVDAIFILTSLIERHLQNKKNSTTRL